MDAGDGARCDRLARLGINEDSLGHVAVYQWNEDDETWNPVGLAITGERRYDRLGSSVSLSSDGMTLAIGVPGADGAKQDDSWGEDSGKTRLFHYTSGAWIELGTAPLGEAAGDRAGSAVSLSGDGTRVVVASTGNDGLGVKVDAGAARVYQWTAAPNATPMPPPTSVAFPDGSSSAAGLPTLSAKPEPTATSSASETWRQFGEDVDAPPVVKRPATAVLSRTVQTRAAVALRGFCSGPLHLTQMG